MKARLLQSYVISTVTVLLLTACATVPQEPLRGVTELTDHVTAANQPFSLAYMPDAGKVSIHIVWPNEFTHSSGKPAVSALGIELMSAGGAGERSARQIKQDLTGLGSGASLVSTPDHIYGSFSSSPETLDETLSIVRDVITRPVFESVRFDVAKEAKQKRVVAQQEKPSARLWRAARRGLLGDSTLTDYWNSTPVDKVVMSLTLDDVRRWHTETFTRQDVIVAVAGSIEPAAASVVIDKLLGELPENRTVVPVVEQPLSEGMTILLHDESAPVTLMAAIGLLPASREGGEIADIVAVSALGKGKESRLSVASADVLGAADKLDASIANFSRAVRVFGINVSVDNNTAADAYQLIEQTYDDFKQGDLVDQEVLRAVVPFANSLRSNDKNPDLLAYGLGQLLLDELPQDMLLSVLQDSVALKADDINQRIVSRYPEWADMIKVVLSSDAAIVDADCVVTQIEEIQDCRN